MIFNMKLVVFCIVAVSLFTATLQVSMDDSTNLKMLTEIMGVKKEMKEIAQSLRSLKLKNLSQTIVPGAGAYGHKQRVLAKKVLKMD